MPRTYIRNVAQVKKVGDNLTIVSDGPGVLDEKSVVATGTDTPRTMADWCGDIVKITPKRLIDKTRMYVDGVNGDDSNDGSISHPWKTIDRFFQMLNEGHDDIRCYIMSGGDYFAHIADTISDFAIHISAHSSCTSQARVIIANKSNSATFYNCHINISSNMSNNDDDEDTDDDVDYDNYIAPENKIVFGVCKIVNGVEDVSTMYSGKIHADNSLITIQHTVLACDLFVFYSCGSYFNDVDFSRLYLRNSKFRTRNKIVTFYNGNKAVNIYGINSDLYFTGPLVAYNRTVLTSGTKLIKLAGCKFRYPAKLLPENVGTLSGFQFLATFNACDVCGNVLTRNNDGKTYLDLSSNTGNGSFAILETTNVRRYGCNTVLYAEDCPTTSFSGVIKKTVSDKNLMIYGGASSTCAQLELRGGTNSTTPGIFKLTAKDSSGSAVLLGSPDGSLKWNGQEIQTSSDERVKTSIGSVPDDVLDAWGDVQWCQYQFTSAVEDKGISARLHNGIVAQRIVSVFEAHGLDACRYGLVCHDVWDDSDDEYDNEGNLISEARESGDAWTVRYGEALAMEAAYQRRRADRMEARLSRLERLLLDGSSTAEEVASADYSD